MAITNHIFFLVQKIAAEFSNLIWRWNNLLLLLIFDVNEIETKKSPLKLSPTEKSSLFEIHS